MPPIWNSLADARDAAKTCCVIYEKTNALPFELTAAIRETMAVSLRPGVIQAFFDTLMKTCPDVVKFFSP